MSRDTDIVASSGNVFADLDLDDADEMMVKAQLALAIANRIEELRLTQTEAAERLKTTQNKVSRMMNAHLDGFSVYRLLEYLKKLDYPVEIMVGRPTSDAPATIKLSVAA